MKMKKNLVKMAAGIVCGVCMAFAMGTTAKAEDVIAATGVEEVGAVTDLRQTGAGRGNISIDYKIPFQAEGCSVEISEDQINWKEADGTIWNLYPDMNYYVRVTPYVREWDDGSWGYLYTYGIPSTIQVVTEPSGTIEKLKHTKSTTSSISLSWDKVKNVNEYKIVYYDTAIGSDNAITKYTKSTSCTLKKLSSDAKYHIDVFPVRKSTAGYRAVGGRVDARCSTVSGKVKGFTNIENTSANSVYDWKCKKYADGYQIAVYNYKDTKYKKPLVEAFCNEWTKNIRDKKLQTNAFYRARIRSYVSLADGGKSYSAWSTPIVFGSSPKYVQGRQTGKKIKVTWYKVTGATGYEVYASTYPDIGYKKVAALSSKKTSCTFSKFNKKALKTANYYIYVKPIRKEGKKTYNTYFGSRPSQTTVNYRK